MTKLSNHQSAKTTKLLFIGDSGTGKTGALASLANAGYNLWIADFDNGLDVLTNLLTAPQSPYSKDAIERVHFKTITDPMKNQGGRLIPKNATAWARLSRLLTGEEKWGEEKEPGPLVNFTDQDVFVIDSLTFLSNRAMDFVLNLNGRLGQKPFQGDWYDGQLMIEGLLQGLYDEAVKCNVIVISHITYIGPDHQEVGYPSTLGKSLPPKVGRYFNSALQAKVTGVGSSRKRVIQTDTTGVVDLKNAAPFSVKKEYPLSSGLADFFKDVRMVQKEAPAAPPPVPPGASTLASAAPAPSQQTVGAAAPKVN